MPASEGEEPTPTMTESVLSEDEILGLRKSYEMEDHWMLRKDFMLANRHDYPPDRLRSLAQAFVNVEILQTTYPDPVMEEIKIAANRVVSLPEFRENREKLSLDDKFKAPPKKARTYQLGTRNVSGHQYFNNQQSQQQQQQPQHHQAHRHNYNQGYQQNSHGYQQQQQHNQRSGEFRNSPGQSYRDQRIRYPPYQQQTQSTPRSYGYGNQQHYQQQQQQQHQNHQQSVHSHAYSRQPDHYQQGYGQAGYGQSVYGGYQPQEYNYSAQPRYGLQSSYAPRHSFPDAQRHPPHHQNPNSGPNYQRR